MRSGYALHRCKLDTPCTGATWTRSYKTFCVRIEIGAFQAMECAGFYTDAKRLVENDQCIPDLKLQCVLGGLILWMDLTSKIAMRLAVTVELCLV